jgi:hypothetical protein
MSTEHQRYSTENQSEAIMQYSGALIEEQKAIAK